MLTLKAKLGFRAVPAALIFRDKAGLRLSEAKRIVDDLSEGKSVTLSVSLPELTAADCRKRVREIMNALRACHVDVEAEAESVAARA